VGGDGDPSHDLCALRAILRECWRLDLVAGDDYRRAVDLAPIRGAALPRGRALDSGELRALFSACATDSARPRGARDACALALLYGCGLRRTEAVGLDLADVDPESGAVTVRRGKGRRARLAYLPSGGRAALSAWLAVRGGDPGPLLHPLLKGGGDAAIEPRRLSPSPGAILPTALCSNDLAHANIPATYAAPATGVLFSGHFTDLGETCKAILIEV
jgi:integrase